MKKKFSSLPEKNCFSGMSGISWNPDLCRSQKYQVCPVSVIIAQENAANRWAIGEQMRQRVTAKDGGVSSVAIEDIPIHYYHSYLPWHDNNKLFTTHTLHDTTTISYQTWIVCIMRPSRFDHVKECSPIENIPHAAEKKKRMWKKVATYWCPILWGITKYAIHPCRLPHT